MTSFPAQLILSQLWNLPAIALAIAGIVLALVRWKKHPTVSLVALIAFSLLLATRLISAALFAYQYWQITSDGAPVIGFYGIVQGALGLMSILSQVLMLLAIFGWRDRVPAISEQP